MWLISSDSGNELILVHTQMDMLVYLEMGLPKEFTIRYVPIWTPPKKYLDDTEKKIYEELVPLSRAK